MFPVHRIYCVGKNYADHIREMGADIRNPPCFFMKPADAVTLEDSIPYPPGTDNFHYETELVLALDKGGTDIAPRDALDLVFGYAIGFDMTRRDLQTNAGRKGEPWDTGKGFDHSAPISAITPAASCGHPGSGRISLDVNGETRQDADLAEMIWKPDEIIAALSRLFTLKPGDLIFTGTPAGVGALKPGDRLLGKIDGLGELALTIS